MEVSPSQNCEMSGCSDSAIGKVRYGVLIKDVENPAEVDGPAIFSDKRFLCSDHYEQMQKEYVFVRIAPL